MPIPLINVSKQNQALSAEIKAALAAVVESGAFILGPEVTKFEEEFRAHTGVAHAIACASGTDALLLPLMAMDVKPGDEVLVPSFTFYATAASVARLGARPVFVDSDESYNLCLDDAAQKISKKTKAIIPVHLFGLMADMPKVMQLAKNAGIQVIEDAAQSQGAAVGGKQAGTFGHYGAYSFYPTKNLGAMGDAGMISASSAEGAEKIRMLRVHGSKERYYHDYVGTNSRLDSMQATVLRIKLRHLNSFEARRAENAAHYQKLFREAGLEESIRLPVTFADRRHVWNQFTIRAKKRDQLRAFLADKGIGSEIYYPLPMHMQKCFASAGFPEGTLPRCEEMAKDVLSLPMFPELTKGEVETVVSAVADFYRA